MAFQIGDTLGDYQIIGILGAGGMGKVYKVKNTISDRVDALKVLLPNLADDPDLADRFIREIKVLASLNHPNIAGLRTAFRLDNQLLMVMEYVEGKSLDERTKAGPIPVADAINYITQALSALGYAHKQGVIHRDIKPANMMLTPDGIIKLMDFGIAKSKSDKKLTQTGTTMGSLFYMSAEQVQGNELDGRSDLYSIGVSLYEMVTGTRPFQGKSDFDIMVAQLQQIPQPPMQMMPNLPRALNDIIMISLEKDPAKRFQTAEAFSAALGSIGNALNATPMQPAIGVAPLGTGTQTIGAVPPIYAAGSQGSATGMMGAQPSSVPPATGGTPPSFLNTASTPTVMAPDPSVPVTPAPVFSAPQTTPAPNPAHGLPQQKSTSYKGLYITLGALIVVAVMAFAAVEGTHFLKARASGDQNSTVTTATNNPPTGNPSTPTPAPSGPDATTPPAGGAASAPAAQPGGNANIASGGANNPSSLPPLGSPDSGAPAISSGAASPGGGASTGSHKSPKHNTGMNMVSGDQNVSNPGGGEQIVPSPGGGQVSAPSTPAPSASNAQDIQELNDLHEKLSSRAEAADQSVENLRQRMLAGGNNMRSDISASQSRMRTYMGKFQAALNAGDAENARKYMTLAEHEVDKLESFLGH